MQSEARDRLNHAMARLADGDRSFATEVFTLLWPELLRFAHRVLGVPSDADDAAQASLEKIFARASDYDPTRSALTWALAIASWECRTVLTARRRASRREGAGAEDLASPLPTPEEQAVHEHMLSALRELLRGLAVSDLQTLEASFIEDVGEPQSPMQRKRKARLIERLRISFRKLYGY